MLLFNPRYWCCCCCSHVFGVHDTSVDSIVGVDIASGDPVVTVHIAAVFSVVGVVHIVPGYVDYNYYRRCSSCRMLLMIT